MTQYKKIRAALLLCLYIAPIKCSDTSTTDASFYDFYDDTTQVSSTGLTDTTNLDDSNAMYNDNSSNTTATNNTDQEINNVTAARANQAQSASTTADKIEALQTQNKRLQTNIAERQVDIAAQNKSPKIIKRNPALASKIENDKKAIQQMQAQMSANNKQIVSLQATNSTPTQTNSTGQDRSEILGKLDTTKKEKKKKRSWYGNPKITL